MKKIMIVVAAIFVLAACDSREKVSIQSLVMPSEQSQYTTDVSMDLVIEDVNKPPQKPEIAAFTATMLKQAGVLSAVNHTYTVNNWAIDANLTLLADPGLQIALLKNSLSEAPSQKVKVKALEGVGDYAIASEYRSSVITAYTVSFVSKNYMVTLTSSADGESIKGIAEDYSLWLNNALQ